MSNIRQRGADPPGLKLLSRILRPNAVALVKAVLLRCRMPTKSDRLVTLCLVAFAPLCAFGQEQPARHVLWIIPNFRTSPDLKEYKPVATKEKFRIAAQDTFDRGTFALAGLFAGVSQFEKSQPSFGQGVQGYARYAGAAFGDFAIGNYMTEAVYPTLLHHDPRYFRRGSGSRWSRLGSAVGQIFWTHTDSGGRQFNYSELIGNSTAVAISMAYYPASRQAGDAVSQLGTQIAVDMATNVVKEFWPSRERTRDVGTR